MKNVVTKLIRPLALSLLLWAVQPASAFYDPSIQRWINRDPINEEGGINLYGFVANDAVNAFDPRGLDIVIDPTASPEFKKRCVQCLCDLQKSRTGKKLYDLLNNNKKITVTIRPASAGEPPDEVPGTGGWKKTPHIDLDPNDPLGIPRDNPLRKEFPLEIPKSCAVVIGHELGHAAGEEDPSKETPRGRNVRRWENPIRLELGEDPRPSYHGWPVEDPRKPKRK